MINELKEKRLEIAKLNAYIDMNITEPLKLKDLQINSLEDKLALSTKTINSLNNAIFENEDIIKNIKSQTNSHKRRILVLQGSEEEKEFKINQLVKSIEDLKEELKIYQEENSKLKCYLEISMLKVKQISEREKNLEVRNSDLEKKNHELSVRAGEGFDSLTPRPSFCGIEELSTPALKSTRSRVKKLLEVAGYKSDSPGRKKFVKKNVNKGSPRITSKTVGMCIDFPDFPGE